MTAVVERCFSAVAYDPMEGDDTSLSVSSFHSFCAMISLITEMAAGGSRRAVQWVRLIHRLQSEE